MNSVAMNSVANHATARARAVDDDAWRHWLSRDDVYRALLAEVDCWHGGQVVTRYLSNWGFVSAPDDDPPNRPYEDRIVSVPDFVTRLPEALSGASRPSWGEIDVAVEDMSWLRDAWDGRAIRLYLGDPSWAKADFRPILTGVLADIGAAEGGVVTLKLRDKQWMLNRPLQERLIGMPQRIGATQEYRVADGEIEGIDAVYDNNGSVPFTANLAEGTFTAERTVVGAPWAIVRGLAYTANMPLPLCFGECINIAPVQVSKALQKYQVHDGPIEAILNVYDNGAPVTFTADLEAGTFVLANAEYGRITADVRGAKVGGVWLNTVPEIVRHIVATRSGCGAEDIDEVSFAALDAPEKVGLYVAGDRNLQDVVDDLTASVGAWYGFDRDGRLRLGRLNHPADDAGSPVLSLLPDDLIDDGVRVLRRELPLAAVKIGYAKNWSVQGENELAGLVRMDPARVARLRLEYLVALARDEARKEKHPLAETPELRGTLLLEADAAQEEAARRLALHDRVRTIYSVETHVSGVTANLGSRVRVESRRFGVFEGIAVGYQESATRRSSILEIWV